MSLSEIVKILLEVWYILVGALFLASAVFSLLDRGNPSRLLTALFWGILAFIFIFGSFSFIPKYIIGALIVVCAVLTVSKQVKVGNISTLSHDFALKSAEVLKNKIFLPSVSIAIVALLGAQLLNNGVVAIGLSAVVALIFTFIVFKCSLKECLQDGDRLIRQVGPVAILPQLLVALGAIFTKSDVGTVISHYISSVVPAGNITAGVIAYCLGMAIFTIIMGNAFAAFSVITLGVGIPFVILQGGDPIVVGALGLTAGYCGTLLTPMAANFNIMPAALLNMNDKYMIIKYQAPVAFVLMIAHIVFMRILAF